MGDFPFYQGNILLIFYIFTTLVTEHFKTSPVEIPTMVYLLENWLNSALYPILCYIHISKKDMKVKSNLSDWVVIQ